ncbi:MAG: hypothetical protein ACYSTO_02600 [Planctomycetota bacterium]
MVYRQIEKLQKMVNSLLGLCAEGKAEAALEDTDLFTQDIRYERLGVLVLKAQDGEGPGRCIGRPLPEAYGEVAVV